MNIDIQYLTMVAKEASLAAGERILEIYESYNLTVEYKNDQSPLTMADKAAHEIILKCLKRTGIPVLSEEGKEIPYKIRKEWEYLWIVDPLDGTKEFIKRNGEFTVNIALIHKGVPVIGVIYAPVLDWLYWGNQQEGSWKTLPDGTSIYLEKNRNSEIKTIVDSKSHLGKETKDFLDKYPGVEVISMGSSLKFVLVAENKAQLYPRFGPTMEWDTAAGQAICSYADKRVLDLKTNKDMVYNRENLLNNWFLVK